MHQLPISASREKLRVSKVVTRSVIRLRPLCVHEVDALQLDKPGYLWFHFDVSPHFVLAAKKVLLLDGLRDTFQRVGGIDRLRRITCSFLLADLSGY